MRIQRREFLMVGAGAFAALAGCSRTESPAAPVGTTVREWSSHRVAPYYIAHRGAGTTVPEHSLPGYLQALEWGAPALELSVVISSDGVLYCHHDTTLDRTTTLRGNTWQTASPAFDAARIDIPRLGPAWGGKNRPAIPRLSTVLDQVGRKAVLCIEAKDYQRAFDPMMELLRARDLLPWVIVKISFPSSRIEQAKSAQLPVFAYLGSADVATTTNISELAGRLSTGDVMVLPARRPNGQFLGDEVLKAAVSTGLPVWVFPIHRRSEVAYFSERGVLGMISPAAGYLGGRLPLRYRDSFSEERLVPGLTTHDPYSDADGLGWGTEGAIEIVGSGQRFVCLGDLSPVRADGYRLDLELAMVSGGLGRGDAFALGFGAPDDSYFVGGSGYQASVTGDGTLSLALRRPDAVTALASLPGTALPTRGWSTLRLTVDPDRLTLSRPDGPPLVVNDTTWRGGYLHIGRTAGNARIAVRNISVS